MVLHRCRLSLSLCPTLDYFPGWWLHTHLHTHACLRGHCNRNACAVTLKHTHTLRVSMQHLQRLKQIVVLKKRDLSMAEVHDAVADGASGLGDVLLPSAKRSKTQDGETETGLCGFHCLVQGEASQLAMQH